MKKRVVHISPHQAGKMVALTFGLLMLPGIPIGIIVLLLGGENRWSGVPFIVFPILYPLTWYLWGGLLTAIFNFVASRFGGIEVTFAEPNDKSGL